MASSRRPKPPPDFDDDAPVLTPEQIKRLRPAAEVFAEMGLALPRGRPKSDAPKIAVTIRLDPEIVDAFKSAGPGWQTRLNAFLLNAVREGKVAP